MRNEASYFLRDMAKFFSGMCAILAFLALVTDQPLWACGAAADGVLLLLLSIAPPVRPPERSIDADE